MPLLIDCSHTYGGCWVLPRNSRGPWPPQASFAPHILGDSCLPHRQPHVPLPGGSPILGRHHGAASRHSPRIQLLTPETHIVPIQSHIGHCLERGWYSRNFGFSNIAIDTLCGLHGEPPHQNQICNDVHIKDPWYNPFCRQQNVVVKSVNYAQNKVTYKVKRTTCPCGFSLTIKYSTSYFVMICARTCKSPPAYLHVTRYLSVCKNTIILFNTSIRICTGAWYYHFHSMYGSYNSKQAEVWEDQNLTI